MSTTTVNRILIWSSWALLVGSTLMWPLSSLTFARDEPQTVLALSWVAIVLSSANTLLTALTKRSADTAADNGGPE